MFITHEKQIETTKVGENGMDSLLCFPVSVKKRFDVIGSHFINCEIVRHAPRVVRLELLFRNT